jgi:hypothetical protein
MTSQRLVRVRAGVSQVAVLTTCLLRLVRHLVLASELAPSHRAPRPHLVFARTHHSLSQGRTTYACPSPSLMGLLSDLLGAHPTLATHSPSQCFGPESPLVLSPTASLLLCTSPAPNSLRATVVIELHGMTLLYSFPFLSDDRRDSRTRELFCNQLVSLT